MEVCNTSGEAFQNASNFSGFADETFGYRRTLAGIVIGCTATLLIAMTAIIGNLAVVLASFWNETLRQQTGNLLIVYLSVVDILTAVLVMIPSAISVAFDYWPLGENACRVQSSCNYMFVCSSSVNLSFISLDRAFAVTSPFKYQRHMTTKVMMQLCGVIFLISVLLGLGSIIPDWSIYKYTQAACNTDYFHKGTLIYYLAYPALLLCFVVPYSLLAVSNILIIKAANRSQKSVQTLFVRRHNRDASLKESVQNDANMKKTIKSMVVVVITYYIFFSPYMLARIIKIFLGFDSPPWFDYFGNIMLFAASATNPFIYAILRKDYRDAFRVLPRQLKEKFLGC